MSQGTAHRRGRLERYNLNKNLLMLMNR